MTRRTIQAPTLRVGGKFAARVFGAGSEAARARVRNALIRQLAGSSSEGEPVTVQFERFVLELTTAAGSRKISREDLTVRLDLGDTGGLADAAPRTTPGPTGNGNGSAVPPAAPPESYRGDDFLRILVKMMVLVWAMGDEEVEDDEGNPGADSGDDEDPEPEDGGGEGMFGLF